MIGWHDIRLTIEEELEPYGQFLAMRGAKEGEQRFGIPEIAVAALVITGWMAKEYVRAYLEEKAKNRAKFEDADADANTEVLKRLDVLLGEIRTTQHRQAHLEAELADALVRLPADFAMAVEHTAARRAELTELLVELGLSERAAAKFIQRLLMRAREERR